MHLYMPTTRGELSEMRTLDRCVQDISSCMLSEDIKSKKKQSSSEQHYWYRRLGIPCLPSPLHYPRWSLSVYSTAISFHPPLTIIVSGTRHLEGGLSYASLGLIYERIDPDTRRDNIYIGGGHSTSEFMRVCLISPRLSPPLVPLQKTNKARCHYRNSPYTGVSRHLLAFVHSFRGEQEGPEPTNKLGTKK